MDAVEIQPQSQIGPNEACEVQEGVRIRVHKDCIQFDTLTCNNPYGRAHGVPSGSTNLDHILNVSTSDTRKKHQRTLFAFRIDINQNKYTRADVHRRKRNEYP